MNTLTALHHEIDARVASIRAEHPHWLCAKGCDNCCRQLAALPQLTAAEWGLLSEGIAALPAPQRAAISSRIEALGTAPQRPVTCPLLDPDTGACPVYAHRPVACRTYGFYLQRDKGLYCDALAEQEQGGALNSVVWGNHLTVERQLAALGETQPLDAWFRSS